MGWPALGLRRTFQQNAFFGELTVLDNTVARAVAEHSTGLARQRLAALAGGGDAGGAEAEAAELLTRFGVAADDHGSGRATSPTARSGCSRSRSPRGAGARALLLDEPAAGTGGSDMRRLPRPDRAALSAAVAVVVIEHHMDLIMAVADRIVVIDQGRKLADGHAARRSSATPPC